MPEAVRRAPGLGKPDKIKPTNYLSGEVVLSIAETTEGGDPVLGEFLRFLANDMAGAPGRVQAVDAQLVRYLRELTKGADIDLDEPLSPDDESEGWLRLPRS